MKKKSILLGLFLLITLFVSKSLATPFTYNGSWHGTITDFSSTNSSVLSWFDIQAGDPLTLDFTYSEGPYYTHPHGPLSMHLLMWSIAVEGHSFIGAAAGVYDSNGLLYQCSDTSACLTGAWPNINAYRGGDLGLPGMSSPPGYDFDSQTIEEDLIINGNNASGSYKLWYIGENDWAVVDINYTATNPIPEPSTMLLLGSGLFGVIGFRKLKKIH